MKNSKDYWKHKKQIGLKLVNLHCRQSAGRKFCIPYRALEEKRREDEEKEQKLREEVLQERKLKQQDATERFQRAHLHSSQRRQYIIGHRNQSIQLDAALEQIHGSFYMSTSPSSAVAEPTVFTGATCLSPNPPAYRQATNVSHHKSQLSAAKAYAKLMQEKSGVNLKNSRLRFQQELQETQRLLGEQQLNSLQEFQKEINQLNQTQSLSSLDSLEIEEQNAVHTSSLKHFIASGKKEFHPLKAAHISAWIDNLDNSRTPISSPENAITNGTEVSTIEEYLTDKQHTFTSKSTESKCPDLTSVSSTEIHQNVYSTKCYNSNQHKESDSNFHSVQRHPTYMDPSESPKGQSAHSAITPCIAWSTPDPTPRETTQSSGVNSGFEFVHHGESASIHPSKLPSATPIFLALSQVSQMNRGRGKTDSAKDSQKIQEAHLMPCVGTTSKSPNSLLTFNQNTDTYSEIEENQTSLNKYNFKVKISHDSVAASQNAVSSQAKFHSSESDSGINITEGKENEPVTYSSMSSSKLKDNKNPIHEKKNNSLKGILKKVSKYGNGKNKSPLSASNVLGIHIASSIRDSVELKKMKQVETDKKPTKKTLRWLDEIDLINQFKKGEDESIGEEAGSTADIKNSGLTNPTQLQSSYFPNNGHIVNVQSNVNNNKESKWNTDQKIAANYDLSGLQLNETQGNITIGAPVISETVSATNRIVSDVSSNDHFTKESWTVPGTRNRDHKMNARNNITEPEKSFGGKGQTKMVKRPHSAKVFSGTGSNCRKGTIIKPISGSEIIISQGKIMVPHPPPKPPNDSKQIQRMSINYNSNCQSQMHPAHVVDICSNTPMKSKPLDKDTIENAIISGLQPQVHSSRNRYFNITAFPSSYSVRSYATANKETYSVNATQDENVTNGTKQDTGYGENTIHLESTPTYEQIALLWHGVRDALVQRDITTGNSQNSLLSWNKDHQTNLQSHRPNVPHLTIDGGSLLNDTQSVSRGGQLFSAPSGARRKNPVPAYSNGAKYRALLQQRRIISSPFANKSDQMGQKIQIQPIQSVFNPVNASQNTKEEVSESTEQFMLAENLVETSAMDTDILAAMDAVKTQQHVFLQNKVKRLGHSALSFEEQKLLQSLDRLNQRLKNIQETIEVSPRNDLLQFPSPVITPFGVIGSGSRPMRVISGTPKHHNVTAYNHAHIESQYSRNKTS
ncbi:centrosomal protein of 126 kDa isoform X2 [Leucoraja erinacea]|uniref:centrosomal protein of 126 kDa isoform X2 n=1 Tax=Leucoraja erinaceus TaxID=7782 RepID=UPI002453A414|nr:centrosomal protein of 126 kDa isoform X2 [Leucoraja erinacea]